jgi:hypothetical protein
MLRLLALAATLALAGSAEAHDYGADISAGSRKLTANEAPGHSLQIPWSPMARRYRRLSRLRILDTASPL